MGNVIAAHANTFHTYDFDHALAGISAAGYSTMELSAVRGWTPHIDVDIDDPSEVKKKLASYGLEAIALSGHSDLTTDDGVALGVRGVQWAASYGLELMTSAIGGHAHVDEDQTAFFERVGLLAEAAERENVVVALEIHGDMMATGKASLPLIERIGSPNIKVKYDTANCEFYGGVPAVDDIHYVFGHLVNIDAKDKLGGKGEWNFPPPGRGHVDWARLTGMLKEAGYGGPFTVEIEFEGEPWPPWQEVVDALKIARQTLESLVQ